MSAIHITLDLCRRAIKHGARTGLLFLLFPVLANATPSHGLSIFGDLKYPAGFKHFEYVNPDAPKGGTLKLAENGSYETLNPFIVKGVKAPGISMIFESLMVSSLDETQAMYGLVAQSVDVADDKLSAEFTMRPQARFHDGTPITPDDVVFSFTTLKEKGDPIYRLQYELITKVEKTGPHKVKFTFKDASNREIAMVSASMPILSKAYYATHDFEKSTFESPLGSGPYKVGIVDAGRAITFERVKNYWGNDLAVNAGMYNFDVIRYDMYRDETVSLEALKAGAYDFRQEYIARNWATAYNHPAITEKRIIKREIEHKIPQGMQAFLFNTRQDRFSDRRVRQAINLSFDYEWTNKAIFYGAYKRNRSFFQNTDFEALGTPGPDELKLLEPFRAQLPPELFTTQYNPPTTDGTGNNRPNLLKARALLEEAGWVIKDGVRVNAKNGEKLTVEFLLRQPTMIRALGSMRKNLEKLGIGSTVRMVDDAQYQRRVDDQDFDVISIWINRGTFFPGNEQLSYWHSSQADIKGSNNQSGVKNPAIDAILTALVNAHTKPELIASARALDRVLQWEWYTIPHWHSNAFRVAYWDKFGLPKVQAKYDIGLMGWWAKSAEKPASNP